MQNRFLEGKKIILGITGGIAAYKSAILARLFIKAGAEVQVIMTPNAKEFITPVTMSAITGKPVITEFFSANTGEWHSHVDLGIWADALVVAPATASSIAKMANGVADNMLITTYLSSKPKTKIFIAPAMDLDMMSHQSTLSNIEKLKSYGNIIIEPRAGELASHLIGKGRMEEPENIFDVVARTLVHNDENDLSDFSGKTVLITAGPTIEKIDPVRYISNFSTGKMGYEIAEEVALRGANVILISGHVEISPKNPKIMVIKVGTALEMFEACKEHKDVYDYAVLCAAVADYRPKIELKKKIKRESSVDTPVISLVKNPDIAAYLGSVKNQKQLLCGFALETHDEHIHALEKLEKKNLDMIFLNSLADEGAGFATPTNKVTLFNRDGSSREFPLKSKFLVAIDVANALLKK